MTTEFKKLFEPMRVGRFILKNRIIYAPFEDNMGHEGFVTQRMWDYYAALAKGGSALLIMGSGQVNYEQGRNSYHAPRFDHDRFIFGLHDLARVVHENGARICVQLDHCGRFAKVKDPVSASDVAPSTGLDGKLDKGARALTTEEIRELIILHGDAAERAKRATFDMVEINVATAYLNGQFVSRRTNHRTDKYGGSFENRIRIVLEITEEIRGRLGPTFPIGYRIMPTEWADPDGFNNEEAIALAKRLEQAEAAYISVLGGTYDTFHLAEGKKGVFAMRSPRGILVKYTEPITKAVKNVPTFINTNIRVPQYMDKLLVDGVADAVMLGRPLLSDPELPKKAFEGRIDDIRLCVGCGLCLDIYAANHVVTCFQNPAVGREREFILQSVTRPKKVLVVGGGPGGLEAARVAAFRGHDVTLYDKEERLGGNLFTASIPPGKTEYRTYTLAWLKRQCEKAGVKVKLNEEVTLSLVEKLKPDAVILATGSSPYMPDIPGIDKKKVFTAVDVLLGNEEPIGKEIIVTRGDRVGAETAEFIARKWKDFRVTIVDDDADLFWEEMGWANGFYLMNKLQEYGIEQIRGKVVEIKEQEVIVVGDDLKRQSLKADSVIVSWGGTPNDSLEQNLRREIWELYVIGDCKEPRTLLEAIHEGAYVARQI